MSTNPFENVELERAERAVARLPRRRLLPARRSASRLGRFLTALAPLCAVATVTLEMKFSFAPASVISVWVALMLVGVLTIAVCVAAGEFGGRWGRISGIVSGIVIVPPIGIALASWTMELLRIPL
ncbi:hypothetical protein [Frigoribacterium sp. RIT-PI-h]|uniref:hypothetical protein n=1 Tax=Frigoribacterium sp. RIT-PI-h TaxID=1690245 RepID=UPI0006CC1D31|nr:hypothetical protein [Frigoribacterium sp. RIT-PI-h]KPG82354.1 hypothetical protein AEQ27_09570 [Frigoribacterium sp. RIT-PI-h]